jgi:transcriptional regulator with XRE-family HTH domain
MALRRIIGRYYQPMSITRANTDDQAPSHPNRLRALREAQGLTREQLAARVADLARENGPEFRVISLSALRSLELGLSRPRAATAGALAKALGRSAADVFPSGMDDPTHSGRTAPATVFLSYQEASANEVDAVREILNQLMETDSKGMTVVHFVGHGIRNPSSLSLPGDVLPSHFILPERQIALLCCCRPPEETDITPVLHVDHLGSGWHRVSICPGALGDRIREVLGACLFVICNDNRPSQ